MKSQTTTTVITTISPEEAVRILDEYEYPNQRSVRPARVAYYAEEMLRGTFLPDTDLRIVDLAGKRHLVNGQHRLHAVVKAGVPMSFNVITRYVETEADVAKEYNLIDRNLTRSAADQYRTLDFERKFDLTSTQVNAVSAAVSLIFNQFNTTALSKLHYADRIFLFESFGSAANLYFQAIRNGVQELASPLKRSSAVALGIITFEFAVETAGEKTVLDYWEGIANDDGLKNTDPRKVAVRHLRNTVLSGGGAVRTARQVSVAYSVRYLINTFNRYARGETYREGIGAGSKVYSDKEFDPVYIVGTPWRGSEVDSVSLMRLRATEKAF